MKISSILSFIAGLLLACASYLFIDFNQPIIKNVYLLVGITSISLIPMVVDSGREFFGRTRLLKPASWTGILFFLTAMLLVYSFLQSALFDYFQPLSLDVIVIYLTLAAFLLLIVRFLISGIRAFLRKDLGVSDFVIAGVSFFFLLGFWGWNLLQ